MASPCFVAQTTGPRKSGLLLPQSLPIDVDRFTTCFLLCQDHSGERVTREGQFWSLLPGCHHRPETAPSLASSDPLASCHWRNSKGTTSTRPPGHTATGTPGTVAIALVQRIHQVTIIREHSSFKHQIANDYFMTRESHA